MHRIFWLQEPFSNFLEQWIFGSSFWVCRWIGRWRTLSLHCWWREFCLFLDLNSNHPSWFLSLVIPSGRWIGRRRSLAGGGCGLAALCALLVWHPSWGELFEVLVYSLDSWMVCAVLFTLEFSFSFWSISRCSL